MRSRAMKALTLTATALALAACGGPEDADANVSDTPEQPVDAEEPTEPAADETAYGFDDIDMDGDSELDVNEFHEWSETPVYAFYVQRKVVEDPATPDQTGALDTDVLTDALYDAWDVNDDEALDRTEWDAATHVIETISDTDAVWVEFDVDRSERVEVAEVRAQLEQDEILAGIDADEDGAVEDEELSEWFFALFDADDDGVVSEEEWRLAEMYLDVPAL